MRTVTPLDSSASSSRLRLWKDSLTDVPASVNMGLEVAESLPAGSGEDWLCWRALNRLRTGVGRAKTVMRRWGYLEDDQSVDCDCGEPHTMAHLSCRLLDEVCTADELATVTERAMECAASGEKFCEGHERRRRFNLSLLSCSCPTRSIDHQRVRRYAPFHSIETCARMVLRDSLMNVFRV